MADIQYQKIVAIVEKELRERLECFQGQLRQMMGEAKADISMLEEHMRQQYSFNMELAKRETKREMVELVSRVEAAQKIIEESTDLRRHLTDIDNSVDGLSRRIESVNNDMLQKHSNQGGLKGRIDTLESIIHDQRNTTLSLIDELHNEIDKKASEMDSQRLQQRLDTFANDIKAVKATNAKLDSQMSDIKTLFTSVNDMNERITQTVAEFETTAVAVSSDLGEVKGKMENMYAKQAAVDLKSNELLRTVSHQMEEHSSSLQSKLESLVNTRTSTMEAKLAQKLDTVLSDTKLWRQEAKQLLSILEARVQDHDAILTKFASQLNGSVADRITQVQNDLRELGKRVDYSTSERKEIAQEVKRELTQMQEVVKGLQEQYDSLLSDAAHRNEMWTDITRDLKTRVENNETSLTHWRTLVDNAVDDIRIQSRQIAEQQFSGVVENVDVLMADREKSRAVLGRIEEDSKFTAHALAELDERINKELSTERELGNVLKKDMNSAKSKIEAMNSQLQNDSMRMAKAVLDLDAQVQEAVRQVKDSLSDRTTEIATLSRNLETLEKGRISAIETKMNHEYQTVMDVARSNEVLVHEFKDVREKIDNVCSTVVKDVRTQSMQCDRLEMTTRSLQSGLDDLRLQVNQAVNDLNNQALDMGSSITSTFAKFEPALKRVDGQLGQLQKSFKDLQSGEDKLQQAVQELQQHLMETNSNVASSISRLDMFTAKPLASDASVKALQLNFDTTVTAIQKDVNSLQSHFQEIFDRANTEHNTKSKVIGSAVMELRTKFDTFEANFKEFQNTTNRNYEEFKSSFEEATETSQRKAEGTNIEVKNLKSLAQKLEVQVNDTKTIGRNLAELTEHVTNTIDELKHSTTGITQELGTIKVKVEKTDRQVRETIMKELTVLNDEVKSKYSHMEMGSSKSFLEINGKLATLSSTVDDFKKRSEDEKVSFKNILTDITKKLSAAEGINAFGARTVADIREDVLQFEKEVHNMFHTSKEDFDKHIRHTMADIEKRLQQILDQEAVIGETRKFGARVVQDIKQDVGEMEKQLRSYKGQLDEIEKSMSSIRSTVVEQVRAAVISVPTQQAAGQSLPFSHPPGSRFDLGSAYFPQPDTESTHSSGNTLRPAVGLDCKNTEKGLVVSVVKPGGPADTAGFRVGDTIVSADGCSVYSRNMYKNIVRTCRPGDNLKHVVKRGTDEFHLNILLGIAKGSQA